MRSKNETLGGSSGLLRRRRPDAASAFLQNMWSAVAQRSVVERAWDRLKSFDRTLTGFFSWRNLKWRFEALRSGRSLAEVEALSHIVYRVEQLFLIHREKCQLLLHVNHPEAKRDSKMEAEMLSTMQEYAPPTFLSGLQTSLEEFRVAGLLVWIVSMEQTYLVAVIRGHPPRDLRAVLQRTLQSVQAEKAEALENFRDDASEFASLLPDMEACLLASYHEVKERPATHRRVTVLTAALAGLIAAAIFLGLRREWEWDAYISRLQATPGLAVTGSHRGWLGPSRVEGLRDPLAPDPVALAAAAKLDPARIRFEWRPYQALDPALVLRRFEMAYAPPATVVTRLENGVLRLSGTAPSDWIETVRADASKLAGITKVMDEGLNVVASPDEVLRRFIDRFGLPDGVEARMAHRSRVALRGEATHAWLARVRIGAKEIPGITEIDDRYVIDVDLQDYKKAKAAVEETAIDFPPATNNLATDAAMALSRLSDQARRCLAAARRLGYMPGLQIEEPAVAVASGERSDDSKQRPGTVVRDFLVGCGLEPDALEVVQRETAPISGDNAPASAGRKVRFKVILKQRVSTP